MSWTRREFLQVAGTTVVTVAAAPEFSFATPPPFVSDGPAWIAGDPYLATADHPGLGGRSFDAARHHALRFRMPADERDRYHLSLENF